MDDFIKAHVLFEDGSTEVIERVIGIDIFKDGDRPVHFISRCGKVCAPRKPTSDGELHEFDVREFKE